MRTPIGCPACLCAHVFEPLSCYHGAPCPCPTENTSPLMSGSPALSHVSSTCSCSPPCRRPHLHHGPSSGPFLSAHEHAVLSPSGPHISLQSVLHLPLSKTPLETCWCSGLQLLRDHRSTKRPLLKVQHHGHSSGLLFLDYPDPETLSALDFQAPAFRLLFSRAPPSLTAPICPSP